MKPDLTRQAQVRTLLEYWQRTRPHIYRGLVARFTDPKLIATTQVAGIFDAIGKIASGTVNAVTNFVSSQGFDKLATAAAPFLANKAEKQAVETEIARISAGLAPKGTTAATAATTTAPPPPPPAGEPLPWKWITGGLVGVGALWLLVSALNRPRR